MLSLGGILGDNLGEGSCDSKIVSRQWGDNFYNARHQGVSQGPLGIYRHIQNYYLSTSKTFPDSKGNVNS